MTTDKDEDSGMTPKSGNGEITRLLLRWRGGSQEALNELMPIVYDELKLLAHNYMYREKADHLAATTMLVHEAYLRLVDLEVDWKDKHHFFALAARMMRRILVDLARRRHSEKRGGGQEHIVLDEAVEVSGNDSAYLLTLNDALTSLSQLDERKSRVLELRFFGGLSHREIAEVLEISTATVERDFKVAKAWLGREMAPAGAVRA